MKVKRLTIVGNKMNLEIRWLVMDLSESIHQQLFFSFRGHCQKCGCHSTRETRGTQCEIGYAYNSYICRSCYYQARQMANVWKILNSKLGKMLIQHHHQIPKDIWQIIFLKSLVGFGDSTAEIFNTVCAIRAEK